MTTLVYIGLIGVFAYHCSAIAHDFRGSSYTIKSLMSISGGIGYMLHYALLIWSFWQFSWWQPIVTAVASIIVGGITAILFQRNFVGMILSPLLMVISAVLGLIGLIN